MKNLNINLRQNAIKMVIIIAIATFTVAIQPNLLLSQIGSGISVQKDEGYRKNNPEKTSSYRPIGKGFFDDSVNEVKPLSIIKQRYRGAFYVNPPSGSTDAPLVNNSQLDLPVFSTQSEPSCNERCVKKGELLLLLHAGGKKMTYEVGNKVWGIVRCTLDIIGVQGGTETTVYPGLELSIKDDGSIDRLPEQLFILDKTENFLGANIFCTDQSSATKYDYWRVKITNIDIPSGIDPEVLNNIRLEFGYSIEYKISPYLLIDNPLIPDLSHYSQTLLGVCDNIPNKYVTIDPSIDYNFGGRDYRGNPITLRWKSTYSICEDTFPNYQVQILRLYNLDQSLDFSYYYNPNANIDEHKIKTTLSWENALTITCGKQKEVTLTLPEGRGYYAWRVRPVGDKYKGGVGNPQNLGSWSSVIENPAFSPTFYLNECNPLPTNALTNRHAIFFYEGFDDGLNWQYARSFDECKDAGPLVSEGITYSNDLSMPRQSQTRVNTDNRTLVSNSVYDYSGRASVTTLPVPIPRDQFVGFQPNTIRDNTNHLIPYTTRNVDDQPGASGTSLYSSSAQIAVSPGSPSGYYSGNDPTLPVPNANGFPFAKAKVGTDGRVEEVGGVGNQHSLGGNGSKTAKIFYGGVSQEELTSVFGQESPNHEAVTKQITIDANGTTSATYISKDGHVIATCLLPTRNVVNDNLSLGSVVSTVDGQSGKRYFTGNFNGTPLMNALNDTINVIASTQKLDKEKDYRIKGNGNVSVLTKELAYAYPCQATITYKVDPYPKFETPSESPTCSKYCGTCDYKITLRLIKNSNLQVIEQKVFISSIANRKNCPPNSETMPPWVINIPEAGSYTLERRAEAFNNTSSSDTPPNTSILTDHTNTYIGNSAQTRTLDEIYEEIFGNPSTTITGKDPYLNHDEYYAILLKKYQDYREGVNGNPGKTTISLNKSLDPNAANCRLINLPPVTPCPSKCTGDGLPAGFKSWELYIVEKLKSIYPPEDKVYQWYYKKNFDNGSFLGANNENRDIENRQAPTNEYYSLAYYFLNGKGDFKDDSKSIGWFNTLISNMIGCGYKCDDIRVSLDVALSKYKALVEINRGGRLNNSSLGKSDKGNHHPYMLGAKGKESRIYFDLYEAFLDEIKRFNCLPLRTYDIFNTATTDNLAYLREGHVKILGTIADIEKCYPTQPIPSPLPWLTSENGQFISGCIRTKKLLSDIDKSAIDEVFSPSENPSLDKFYDKFKGEFIDVTNLKDCFNTSLPNDCLRERLEAWENKCKDRCTVLAETFKKEFINLARNWSPPKYPKNTQRSNGTFVQEGDPDELTQYRIDCAVRTLTEDCNKSCGRPDLTNLSENIKIEKMSDWIKTTSEIQHGKFKLTSNTGNGCPVSFRQVNTFYPNNEIGVYELAADFLNTFVDKIRKQLESTKPPSPPVQHDLISKLDEYLTKFDPSKNSFACLLQPGTSTYSTLSSFTIRAFTRNKFIAYKEGGKCKLKFTRFTSCYSSTNPHPLIAELNTFLNERWANRFGYSSIESYNTVVSIDGKWNKCQINQQGWQERYSTRTPSMYDSIPLYARKFPSEDGERDLRTYVAPGGLKAFTTLFDDASQPFYKYFGNTEGDIQPVYLRTGDFNQSNSYSYINTKDVFKGWEKPEWYVRRYSGVGVTNSDGCSTSYDYDPGFLLLEFILGDGVRGNWDIYNFSNPTSSIQLNFAPRIREALGNSRLRSDLPGGKYISNQRGWHNYREFNDPCHTTKYREGWYGSHSFSLFLGGFHDTQYRYADGGAGHRTNDFGGFGRTYQFLQDVNIFQVRRANQTTNGDWYSFGTFHTLFPVNTGQLKATASSWGENSFIHSVKLVPRIEDGIVVGVELMQAYGLKNFGGGRSIQALQDLPWVSKVYYNPIGQTADVTDVVTQFINTPFTQNIGYFSQTDDGYLVYNDIANGTTYIYREQTEPNHIGNRRLLGGVRFATEESVLLADNCSCGCPSISACDAFCVKYEYDIENPVVTKVSDLTPNQRKYLTNSLYPTCESIKVLEIKDQIRKQYDDLMLRLRTQVKTAYTTACNADSLNDEIIIKDTVFAHHYTLYYYDRAGNLVRSVPPRGVDIPPSTEQGQGRRYNLYNRLVLPNHTLASEYKYNSFGQMISNYTPDGGDTWYGYNQWGQLRLTQTQYQRSVNKYSYIDYDHLGRAKETGEASTTGLGSAYNNTDPFSLEQCIWSAKNGVNAGGTAHSNKAHVSSIQYTTKVAENDMPKGYRPDQTPQPDARPTTQRFLRNRVSKTEYDADGNPSTDIDRPSTIYSYDEHGNTEWLIRTIPIVSSGLSGGSTPMLSAKIEYDYDLISGNVNMVRYRSGFKDRFFRKFEYDADNRLSAVFSSRDSVLWEQDVRYSYYPHGPLRRAVIGEDSLQGRDYVYTLHGWLKAINHTAAVNGDPSFDPGGDGADLGTNRTKVAKDAFGEILNYYNADFESADGKYNATNNKANVPNSTQLYDGNISAVSSRTQEKNGAGTPADPLYDGAPTGNTYRYDVVGRLRSDYFIPATVNSGSYDWVPTLNSEYNSEYEYDENGNIEALDRNGYPLSGATSMDRLTYNYGTGVTQGNRLQSVSDAGTTVYPNTVQDIRGTQVSNNYQYDVQGRLKNDVQEGLEYEWLPSGKIGSVKKNGTLIAEFLYDAEGNRVRKTVYMEGNPISTYYVYGEDGSVSAIYKQVGSNPNNVYLSEVPLYGTGRLGMMLFAPSEETRHCSTCVKENDFKTAGVIATRRVGAKLYELTDHLGNVRAVIGDVKLAEGGSFKVDLRSYANYYPYGMAQPNRDWVKSNNKDYRYGYNGIEEDDELKGDNNSLSTYYRLYDPRLALWLGIDPVVHESESPYAFVSGNPILYADPSGADKEPIQEINSPISDPNKNEEIRSLAQNYTMIKYNGVEYSGDHGHWSQVVNVQSSRVPDTKYEFENHDGLPFQYVGVMGVDKLAPLSPGGGKVIGTIRDMSVTEHYDADGNPSYFILGNDHGEMQLVFGSKGLRKLLELEGHNIFWWVIETFNYKAMQYGWDGSGLFPQVSMAAAEGDYWRSYAEEWKAQASNPETWNAVALGFIYSMPSRHKVDLMGGKSGTPGYINYDIQATTGISDDVANFGQHFGPNSVTELIVNNPMAPFLEHVTPAIQTGGRVVIRGQMANKNFKSIWNSKGVPGFKEIGRASGIQSTGFTKTDGSPIEGTMNEIILEKE
jgi:RHS repeat-associated protein